MRTATNCGKMTIIVEPEEMNVVDLTICILFISMAVALITCCRPKASKKYGE